MDFFYYVFIAIVVPILLTPFLVDEWTESKGKTEDKRMNFNNLNDTIEYYEKQIKEYELLIKTNDSYNFSQIEWKHKDEEYKQLVNWLKELKELKELKKQVESEDKK